MTLPTFVAATSAGDDTSSTSITVTRPGSGVLNRVYLVALYKENANAVTASGWTQVTGSPTNNAGAGFWIYSFWLRDNGSSPTSWSFSWTGSSWRGYVCLAFDDVQATGDPTEQYAGGTGNSATITGPTITTAGADRLRMFVGGFFYGSGSSWAAPSVGTLRGQNNSLVFAASEDRATAGATGTITIQNNVAEIGQYAAACYGLIGASAASYTFALAIASTSSTPDDAVLNAGAGSYTFALAVVSASTTPDDATLNNDYVLALAVTSTSSTPDTALLSSGAYGSLRFYGNDNGSGTTNIDRVRIPRENPLGTDTPADVGSSDYTFECWLLPDQSNNDSSGIADVRESNIFWDGDIWGDSRGQVWGLTNTVDGLVQCFGIAGGGSWTTIYGTTDLADNDWHHLALTRDQSTGEVVLWIDGVQDANGTYTTGSLEYPDGVSGSSPNGSDHYWVLGAEKHDADEALYLSYYGYMSELRISNSERYTGTFTRPSSQFTDDANTMVLFHFDEGSGTTLDNAASVANAALADGIILVGGTAGGPDWSLLSPFAPAYTFALGISSTSTTPDDATLSMAYALALAAASTSSTPDDALLANGHTIALAIASQSSTPDDSLLSTAHTIALAIASQSATPPDVSLAMAHVIVMGAVSSSTTPNDVALAMGHEIALATASLSTTPDDVTISAGSGAILALAINSQSTTPDDANLTAAYVLALAIASQSTTPNDATLNAGAGDVSLALAVVSASTTPDDVALTINHTLALGVVSGSSTPAINIYSAIVLAVAVGSQSTTPNTVNLVTSSINGVLRLTVVARPPKLVVTTGD